MSVQIINADCLSALRELTDESVDAVVTDPPYGLANTDSAHVVETLSRWFAGERDYIPSGKGFMGKAWDAFVPPPAVWDECFRVLKPGGHLLCFAGTRTVDLMGLSVRLAGFDLRDSITWLYGSGFPKSLDVGKAIDKAAGAPREVVGTKLGRPGYSLAASTGVNLYAGSFGGSGDPEREAQITAPATTEAQQWHGWGTALKPASEPIVVARKPLRGNVAANVLTHGTGALNIDGCRVGMTEKDRNAARVPQPTYGVKAEGAGTYNYRAGEGRNGNTFVPAPAGRWPANVVMDGAAADALDEQSGTTTTSKPGTVKRRQPHQTDAMAGTLNTLDRAEVAYGDTGGASRFYPVFRYQAKAPSKERPTYTTADGRKIAHPTVKPLALMRWLVRLVTPPGGTVLDPFAGSGTTVEAALLEGFNAIGIERDADYIPLIEARVARGGGDV